MKSHIKIPQPVIDCFKERGIDTASFIACIKADMDMDLSYTDSWVAMDIKSFYVLYGSSKVRRVSGSRRLASEFNAKDLLELPLDKIKDLKIDRAVSSARLLVEVEEGNNAITNYKTKTVATFSLGLAAKFETFARILKKVQKGENYDNEKLNLDGGNDAFYPHCGTRFPDPARKICPECLDRTSLTIRLLSFFRYYYKQALLIILFMLFSSALNLLSPYVGTRMFFDEVLTEGGRYFGKVLLNILLIVGASGKEVGIIREVSVFNEHQAAILRRELLRRYYCPIIENIISLKDKMGYLYFTVKTSSGVREFAVRDVSRSIKTIDDARLVIVDVDGNRYTVNDMAEIDQASMKKLEPYLF